MTDHFSVTFQKQYLAKRHGGKRGSSSLVYPFLQEKSQPTKDNNPFIEFGVCEKGKINAPYSFSLAPEIPDPQVRREEADTCVVAGD